MRKVRKFGADTIGSFLAVLRLSMKNIRTSRSQVFYKKAVMKNFIRKIDLCQSLFFDKVTGLQLATLS